MNRDMRLCFSLIVLCALFSWFYIGVALENHKNFFTNFDLAIFDQSLRSLSDWHLPVSNLWGIPVIFGDHFYPIIALLAPLYRLWPDPRMLLVLQTLLLVCAVIPLYFLGKHFRLPRWQIFAVSVLYLTFPGLQTHVMPGGDFHELAFAPLLFFSLAYFLLKRNWLWYSFVLALLLVTKENLAIYLGFFSILIFCYYKERRIAVWTAIACTAAFVLTVFVLMPIFSGRPYFYFQFLSGSEPFQWQRFVSPFIYSLPFLGAILGAPALAVLFFPLLLEKGLSAFSLDHFFAFQHVIFFGLAGILTFLHLLGNPRRSPLFSKLALGWAICAALSISWAFGLPLANNGYWFGKSDPIAREGFTDLLSEIPARASVAAHHVLLPHLTERQFLYPLPKIKYAEYVIDLRADTHLFTPAWTALISETLQSEPAYRLIKENKKGRVFQRIGAYTPQLEKKLDDLCGAAVAELGKQDMYRVPSAVMTEICKTN